jgi:hypothetical protein
MDKLSKTPFSTEERDFFISLRSLLRLLYGSI